MVVVYTIAILLVLSILTWYISIKAFPPNATSHLARHHPPMISVEGLVREVDNGDLVFFAGESDAEKAIRLYSGSHFNHVALVIREFDDISNTFTPYLFEADVGGTHRTGVRVVELEKKLETVRESPRTQKIVGWKRLITTSRPTSHDMVIVARELVGYGMDMSMMCWLFSNYPDSVPFRYFRPEDDVVFCSELVAIALGRLGLLSEKDASRHPTSFSPGDFASGRVGLAKCMVYSETMYALL